jgi:hypothetical protein
MADQLTIMHDRLLANQPEGTEPHDAKSCAICVAKADTPSNDPGGSSMADFTQEQLDAAVAKAVAEATAPLQEKLAELTNASALEALEAAMAEAIAPFETAKTDLQSKLDIAEAAKTAAETTLSETLAFLKAEDEAKAAAEALTKVKDERLTELKAAQVVDDKYADDNIDRFAAMSAEDWELTLSSLKAVRGDRKPIPTTTAFKASREGDEGAGGAGKSNLRLIGQMKREGVDVRNVS